MADIPRVLFEINPDDPIAGVKVMSLVDQPAIESDFIFFKKETGKYVELKSEKYKQVVAGLALIPDKDILRYDENGNPYYGYFTTDSIEVIRNKFHQELMTNRVNTDHSATNYVPAYLIESFIIDSDQRLQDVISKGIKEATLGSWFVAYKIEDQKTFERVLAGELKGFSVEIFLSKFWKSENNFNKQIENKMNEFIKKFKELLAEAESKTVAQEAKDAKVFDRGSLPDGTIVEYTAVGEPVNIVTPASDGTESLAPAPDGVHALDNGFTVTVASGIATEIIETPVQQSAVEDHSKKELEGLKSENENFKKELAELKKELEAIKAEKENFKQEIEKLKEMPITTPVIRSQVVMNKITDQDLEKMSNAERILYQLKNKK